MIENSSTIIFDKNVFSLETIKGALYKFSDISSFDISCQDNSIKVTIYSTSNLDELTNKIRNEVLDQDLRSIISMETSNIRTLILANAFSNTKLID